MATPAQLTANRANAQASTGPRSVEGKTASSRNSLKSGLHAKSMIIPGEDPEELEELSAAYRHQFTPVGPVETELLRDLIRLAWMKRRYHDLENEVLNSRIASLPEDTPYVLGAAMIHDTANGDTLGKVFRRLQATDRDWDRVLRDLTRLQVLRRRDEDRAAVEVEEDFEPGPSPNRVRFSAPPLPVGAAPAVNLALRL